MDHSRYLYNKHYDLYLTEEDYRYLYFVNPLQFLLNNVEKESLPLKLVFGSLQNSIRDILYIFFNYPFTRFLYNYYRNKFLRLLPLVEYLDSRGVELRDFKIKLRLLKKKYLADG